MIEYIEEPHFAHHIEPAIEHVKLTAAQYYTSILSQFTNHKNDKDVHVTREDREKWDNKADKVSLYDLEQRIVDKANKKDIPTLVSELKNDVPYLTASSIDAKLDDKGYVTWEEIKNNISKNLNLDNYLTKTQADSIYSKKSDMTSYITSSTISNYLGDYIKRNSTLFYYNGSPVSFGGSISAPTSSGDQSTPVTPYTLPQATSSVLGGIKIGYQPIGGTKIYPVELDNEGKAFVRVPWVAAESSSDQGSSSEIPEDIQDRLDALTSQINSLIDFINGQQLTDKVTTIVDQKTGSWTTIVSDLENTKSAITILSNQFAALSQWTDQQTLKGYISALATHVDEISATVSMVASGLQYDETTGTWVVNPDVMAAIIAEVEGDSSLISLIADRVDVVGVLNATDLTINGGKSRFNRDGSGYVANGNISWNTSGTVSIQNDLAEYTVTPNTEQQRVVLSANSPSNIMIEYVGAGRSGVVPVVVLPTASECAGKSFEIVSTQIGGESEEIGFASSVYISSNVQSDQQYVGPIRGHVKIYSNGVRWILLYNDVRFPVYEG